MEARELLKELLKMPGGDQILKCIQCGTCTGSCPMAPAMDYGPRKLLAMAKGGDFHEVFDANTYWICASCYFCTVRCPRGIMMQRYLMKAPFDALKNASLGLILLANGRIEFKVEPVKDVAAFKRVLERAGATAYFSLDELMTLVLPARVMAIAEDIGADTVITPCNACYATLRKARAILANEPELKGGQILNLIIPQGMAKFNSQQGVQKDQRNHQIQDLNIPLGFSRAFFNSSDFIVSTTAHHRPDGSYQMSA